MGNGGIIATRENGHRLIRSGGMLKSHSHARAGLPGGASTNGIHHHHDGAAARGESTIDIGGGARFFYSVLGEIAAHGREELFWVGHRLRFYFDRSHEESGGD